MLQCTPTPRGRCRPGPSKVLRSRVLRQQKSSIFQALAPPPLRRADGRPEPPSRAPRRQWRDKRQARPAPPSSASFGSNRRTSGISPLDGPGLDVGRIGHQQIERPAHPLAANPAAASRRRRAAPARPRPRLQHWPGPPPAPPPKSPGRRRCALRIFAQQGQQQAARAQAEIEDAPRPVAGPASRPAPPRSAFRCRAAAPARPARP